MAARKKKNVRGGVGRGADSTSSGGIAAVARSIGQRSERAARKPSRPAPRVQPGPVRAVERAAVKRHVASPAYKRRLRETRRERAAEQTAADIASLTPLLERQIRERKRGGLLAELEGTGKLASISNTLGGALAPHLARLHPLGLGAAALDVAGVDAPAQFMQRAARDVVNFPAQAIPSLYVPAAAGVEAARGDSSRLNEVIEGIKTQDPVYAALTGDFSRAAELASEHPGYTALEVYGLKGAVGRGVGRIVRGVGRVTGRPTFADTRTRPNATVPGTRLEQERSYSRDVFTKGAQVVGDRRGARQADRLRREADAVEATDPEAAVDLRRRANVKDPERMSERQVGKRVDLYEQASERRRQRETAVIDKRLTRILRESGDDEAALSVVAQGIAKADPKDLKAYRDELAAAGSKLKDASKRAANAKLVAALDRSLKRADKDPEHARKVAEAAQAFAREVDEPLDRVLTGLGVIDPERAARAKLIPYAARNMGAVKLDAHWRDTDGRIVSDAEVEHVRRTQGADTADALFTRVGDHMAIPDRRQPSGYRFVSDDEIRAHMRDPDKGPGLVDPDDVSYISQRPSAKTAGDYYRSSYREPTVGASRRTERGTVEGTFAGDPEAMRARALRSANMAVTADNFRGFLRENAAVDADGKPYLPRTYADAEGVARSLRQSTGTEWQVVRARPFGASRDQFDAMLDKMGDGLPDARAVDDFRTAMEAALEGKGGDGPFVVIPRAAASRMQQHLRTLGPSDFGKFARAGRSAFTRTVLSTSPGPTFGNAAEGVFRSVLNRSGLLSQVTARRVLRLMDPDDANALLDRAVPGGNVTLMTSRRHFAPEQLQEGVGRRMVARYQAAKRLPVGKQAVGAWQLWTHFVFDVLNGKTERFFQLGHLGKAIRDSGLMTEGTLRLSNGAMKQAAEGLRNTHAQARMADAVYDAYGKYNGFSPSTRVAIAEYTPFLAWYGSSWNFLVRVLPRDHPTLLAITASMQQVTEDWRKGQGLDLFMRGDDRLPGWLQGTIDTGGSFGRVKATYNTPFGAFTDPTDATAGLVLPQIRGVIDAFEGRDWKGKRLRNKDGSEYDPLQRATFAFKEFVRASVPAVAVPTRISRYAQDPSRLASPVRVPPSPERSSSSGAGGAGVTPREAQRLLRGVAATGGPQGASAEEIEKLLRGAQAAAGR